MKKTASSINEVYNVLSDILGIAGRYSADSFSEATKHVDLNTKGLDRDVLLNILKELQRLTNEPTAKSSVSVVEPPKTKAEVKTKTKAEVKTKTEDRADKPVDWAKEVAAILEDTQFLPGKKDLLKVIRKHFGRKVTIRPDNRDSRRDLTTKTVSTFRKMSKIKQRTTYSALKKAYMKRRRTG